MPPTLASGDICKSIQQTKQDARYKRGQSLLKDKRYEEAIGAFSDYLNVMDDQSTPDADGIPPLGMAPIYYQYGNALLFAVEESSELFGSGVDNTKQDPSAAPSPEEEKEATSDVELAWEMLEVARLIYSRYQDPAIDHELATVYLRLGDLGMESGQFEQARGDFMKSLSLTKQKLDQDRPPIDEKDTWEGRTSRVVDILCLMAMSCVYESYNKEAEDPTQAGTLLNEGLEKYVEAGTVYRTLIHDLVKKYPSSIQRLVEQVLPLPKAGNGKQKLAPTRELPFEGKYDEFQAQLEKFKEDNVDLAELQDKVEIYIELKEKAAGLVVSIAELANKTKDPPASSEKDAEKEKGVVTEIGFGENKENSSKAATISVPVRKKEAKRKTEGSSTEEKVPKVQKT